MNRQKRNNIIYWIVTGWLALGMLSTAIVQLMQQENEVQAITALGYPVYLLTIIGCWKILGVIAVLLPRLVLVKEWAYAGFFFVMSGAVISHIVSQHGFTEIAPALLLLFLTILSWYFRPPARKIVISNIDRQNF